MAQVLREDMDTMLTPTDTASMATISATALAPTCWFQNMPMPGLLFHTAPLTILLATQAMATAMVEAMEMHPSREPVQT